MTGTMEFHGLGAPATRTHERHSPTRSAVLELVQQRPGIHMAEVQRRLGLAEATIRHHVNRLTRRGLVRRAALGRSVALFPPHATSALDPATHAYRRADGARIVDVLLERPAITMEELAEALDEPITVTRRRVMRLRRAEVIITEGGRPHRLSVDATVWQRLAPLVGRTGGRGEGPAYGTRMPAPVPA